MTREWILDSELGKVHLTASDQGVRSIYFNSRHAASEKSLDGEGAALEHLRQAVRELDEYFAGRRREFGFALDVHGTPFQRSVWSELIRIPYGATCSYSQIAARLKKQGAVRAVGTANGRNPICIVVPCHRVIAADGSLGGYSGGLEIKRRLLEIEGVQLR